MTATEVLNRSLASSVLGLQRRLLEAAEVYAQFHKIEGSTPGTIGYYQKHLRYFQEYLESEGLSDELAETDTLHIMKYLESLKDRGLAPRTVKGRHGSLFTFFAWAQRWEFITVNPVAKLRPPKVPKTRKGFLSEVQFSALVGLCAPNTFLGDRRLAILWMLITTGMRHNELALLNLDDLDWKKGQIRVIHGKGQKERSVPFHREAQRAMLKYLSHRRDDLKCLWVTEERGVLSHRSICHDMHRCMARAEVKVKDRMHIFRRTWAANAVRQGVPRPYVQSLAGWSTPTMMDEYTAAMQGEEAAIEALRDFDPWR